MQPTSGERVSSGTSGVVLTLADALSRMTLRYHLAPQPEFRIMGEAGNGQQAIQLVEYTDPDIVLIEMDLPGVNGLEVARAIKRSHPHVSMIVLSSDQDQAVMLTALRAGVAAFLPRTVSWDDVRQVLHDVRRGEYPITDLVLSTPALAAAVLDEFRSLRAEEQGDNMYVQLSPREIDVLELVAAGRTNNEITVTLNMSNQTLKHHLSSILRKLAVND